MITQYSPKRVKIGMPNVHSKQRLIIQYFVDGVDLLFTFGDLLESINVVILEEVIP